MTVENTLEEIGARHSLTLPRGASAHVAIDLRAPRAMAAAEVAAELQRSGQAVTAAALTAAIERAEAAGEALLEPFFSFDDESSGGPTGIDFVGAFVELVNRGFYGPGRAQVSERLALSVEGDMRWRLSLDNVPVWAVQALWLAFGWFRRGGGPAAGDEHPVFVEPVGAPGATERAIAELPQDPDIDLEELLDCKDATLRINLSREPDDATLHEIYRCLELWQRVVAPGFPRYGGFMTAEERPALDTPREVALELPAFRHCDPRAMICIKSWVAREGERLGIAGYELEAS
jgi:hypothetical protein